MACAPSEDSDKPGHPPSLISVFAASLKKARSLSYPLSAHRGLWPLGGCPGWSESSLDAYAILLVLSRCGSFICLFSFVVWCNASESRHSPNTNLTLIRFTLSCVIQWLYQSKSQLVIGPTACKSKKMNISTKSNINVVTVLLILNLFL